MGKSNNIQRINWIDIARAFAIIFIVLGHTINHSEHCGVIFKFIYSFHVVLFFIISGYLFKIKEDVKFIEFLKNKFIRIMIPYLVWAIVFLIPYMLLGSKVGEQLGTNSSFDLKSQLINIMYGNGNASALKQNSALWFLPALFTMEVIFYLIIKYVNKHNGFKIPILILTIIIGYITKFLPIYLPLGINTVLNAGLFFYIGYLLKEYKLLEENSVLYKKHIIMLLLIIGVSACFLNKDTVSYMDYRYGNYVLALLSGVCLSICVIYGSYLINKNKILEHIGRNTMGILIFHKLIVLIFQTKLGVVSQLLFNSNIIVEFIVSLIIVAINVLFCLIGTEIVKKIAPIVIGEKRISYK